MWLSLLFTTPLRRYLFPFYPPAPSAIGDIFLTTSSPQANMPTFAYHKNNCYGEKQRRKEKRQKGSGTEP
jgi:hypothetical protein